MMAGLVQLASAILGNRGGLRQQRRDLGWAQRLKTARRLQRLLENGQRVAAGDDHTGVRQRTVQNLGKLETGYFWPLYGDQDEVAFPFAASRAGAVGREVLGSCWGVLLTDGYVVYDRFAQRVNRLVHAQCWSHTSRHFVDAEGAEPALVAQALEHI